MVTKRLFFYRSAIKLKILSRNESAGMPSSLAVIPSGTPGSGIPGLSGKSVGSQAVSLNKSLFLSIFFTFLSCIVYPTNIFTKQILFTLTISLGQGVHAFHLSLPKLAMMDKIPLDEASPDYN